MSILPVKNIIDDKINIILECGCRDGATMHAATLYNNNLFLLEGGFRIKADFQRNEMLDFVTRNNDTVKSKSVKHYSAKLLLKTPELIGSRGLDITLVDRPSEDYAFLMDRDFSVEKYQEQINLMLNKYSRNAIIQLIDINSIVSECPAVLPSFCTPERCKECRYSNGKIYQENKTRSTVKNRLRAIIDIASTTRTPLAILITHCASDKSKIAKIAKEVLTGFFNDMGVKNPPNIYFTDGLLFDTCFDITNPASALLDVIAQVLRKSSPRYKGAVYQSVFGSDISIASEITNKIENYLEKNCQ